MYPKYKTKAITIPRTATRKIVKPIKAIKPGGRITLFPPNSKYFSYVILTKY